MKEEESRDRTNRGERAPECRHIRDILARLAIFSRILYLRDAAFANALPNPRSLLLEKYSAQYVDDAIYLSFRGEGGEGRRAFRARVEISILNNLTLLFFYYLFYVFETPARFIIPRAVCFPVIVLRFSGRKVGSP